MHHMRVLRPAGGIFAFYDGRVEGYRFAEALNWVDEVRSPWGSPATRSSTATRR